ncbi:YggW family oxidoreductase [Paraphotobacterium marinum]|uniref:Heme chaperone HemW n=1 Tax=Paraphotobacterium marinum TaxID=1755811 RepID=A0A220VBX0_9GAMM|nr:radical SAM family heme chaperone HemW [Paraphotobacterium marinum]ASK77894.1 YggW family oxidoreductase [Paraphotobacterium marinum]
MNKKPVSLYIHMPWCIKKCPYCDFNSHTINGDIPEKTYIEHLIKDLKNDIEEYNIYDRPVKTIFFGGGTPSLITPAGYDELLSGIKLLLPFKENIEITMEANPGTLEHKPFQEYINAGINRFSVGVQSFNNEHLNILGRIHSNQNAITALEELRELNVTSYNLDLMHGLPQQNIKQALSDLHTAIELNVPHISWYQLTIEPHTMFSSRPPTLPSDDILWLIYKEGIELLKDNGYEQYEISAFSKQNHACEHNLNYWEFGDYLGVGCGASGKITTNSKQVIRTEKVKHPKGYLEAKNNYIKFKSNVTGDDLVFEYFLNRCRLMNGFSKQDFEHKTGLKLDNLEPKLNIAQKKGLITYQSEFVTVTTLGHRYLNNLLELFI